MKIFLLIIGILFLFSYTNETQVKLRKGIYRAVLRVKDNKKLPFIFEVKNDFLLTIFNADETIIVDKIKCINDSVRIQTLVFEGYIIAKIDGKNLKGNFIKPSLNRVLSFKATKNRERFSSKKIVTKNISGNRETVFNENYGDEKYIAKGMFYQKGNKVTGTFRTTTGDYRYLEGIVEGDSLKLSTFDGAYAFLFTAKITDSILNGVFYSDNHWKEPFTTKFNNTYQLLNEDNLTFRVIRLTSVLFDFDKWVYFLPFC